MKLIKYKFSELSDEQIKKVTRLTIGDSSFIRYLNNFIDAREDNDQEEMKKYDYTIYLAEADSILGWTMIGTDEDFGFGEEGTVHLFVDESQRGLGLGSKLFKAAMDEVKSQGFYKVLTYAHDENSKKFFTSDKAKAVCESQGIEMDVID